MKRIVVLLFVLLLPLAASFAQASFLTPSGHDEEAEVPAADMPADPGSESAEWARNLFAGFVRDTDMCDDGTALFEDRLRQQAMKEHPEWPVWSIDLALEESRDSYLRAMLFAK